MDSPGQYQFSLDPLVHPLTAERRAERASLADADEGTQKSAILARHRQEWSDHLDLWWDAHHTRNLKLAQLAKTQAETLRARQAEERKVWGLDGMDSGHGLSPEENLARIRELLQALSLGPAH